MGTGKKKILITGGLGFLGQHLINKLLKQYPECDITILDKARIEFFIEELNKKSNINIISNVDITDMNTIDSHFKGIDVVFHVAAMISFWSKDKKALYKTNISMVENVIKICKKENVKRLIYVSSTAALGFNNDKNNPTDETYRFDWRKARGLYYMLSKYYAEQKVKEACTHGLQAVIANPSTMFGPGDRKGFQLIENLLSGKVAAMPPGGFSITDVREIARALVSMIENGKIGENYLLVGGNYTYREMLTTFAEVLNVKPPLKVLPVYIGPIITRLIRIMESLSVKQPKLTKEILAPGFKYRYYSSAKAEKELNWKSSISLKKTFQDSYDFYKNQIL